MPGLGQAVGDLSPSKRRLGRGLGSLIGVTAPISGTATENRSGAEGAAVVLDRGPSPFRPGPTDAAGPPDPPDGHRGGDEVRSISVDAIAPSPFQPRQRFDQPALDALAASIRTAGVMQPIVVRPRGGSASRGAVSASGERYEIIAGERRFRAAKQLGLPTIPAIVRAIDDRTAAEWAIIENLQREDLNPIERAAAFRRLVDEFGMSQQEVGEQVGLDRSTISNLLRLNDLEPFTSDAVRDGRLSMGHARALLGCADAAARAQLAATAIRSGWSVRKTEQAVAAGGARRRPKGAALRPASAHVAALERRLGVQLGTRVLIEPGRTKGAGRLVIEYFSLDQFEGLLGRMGVDGNALRDV